MRRNYSRNVLLRLLVLATLAVALLLWKRGFLTELYLANQLTAAGTAINGGIVVLFLIGLARLTQILLRYNREEQALERFVVNLTTRRKDPVEDISERSLIARRYRIMEVLNQANSPIAHESLASSLVASESTRASLPRFISNILILTGVFGTVIALSIALLGASSLLESVVSAGGMNMVIHGMSTALSTTITAIFCYFFFGYFYLKMTDVQTNLVSGIEQVTTIHLVGRFQVEKDSVLYEFSGLIRSMQELINQMSESHGSLEQVERRLLGLLEIYHDDFKSVSGGITDIKALLQQGFRLPPDLS